MIINGKKIAAEILGNLKREVPKLPLTPLLCDIIVGQDPVSLKFVNIKGRVAKSVGMDFKTLQLSKKASEQEIINAIVNAQKDPVLKGLIVQLPLPKNLERKKILDAVNPKFDIDCIGNRNKNLFYSSRAYLTPPTAAAIMAILNSLELDFGKKTFLVVGQGELVGKPVTFLLKQRGLQVRTADRNTTNLGAKIKNADVVISATGQPKLIKGSMIKKGAIVIDAGTSESEGGIVGDVDFKSVSKIAGAISPVPGGVGPVTVAKLLENVILVAKRVTRP